MLKRGANWTRWWLNGNLTLHLTAGHHVWVANYLQLRKDLRGKGSMIIRVRPQLGKDVARADKWEVSTCWRISWQSEPGRNTKQKFLKRKLFFLNLTFILYIFTRHWIISLRNLIYILWQWRGLLLSWQFEKRAMSKLRVWKKDNSKADDLKKGNLRVVNLKEVGWILWSWVLIIG